MTLGGKQFATMNAPCVVSCNSADDAQREPVRYIQSHTALRGVAALLVVAYHLQFGANHRLTIETATPFFERGYLMVDLFFILSGFVISLTNDVHKRRPFSGQETWRFYGARLARIYPLHLFCLCFILLSTAVLTLLRQWHRSNLPAFHVNTGAVRSLFAELFLVQAWIPGMPFWNIPSWSISAESTAYVCFPLFLMLRNRTPRLAVCMMIMLALVFYLAVLLRGGSLDIIAGLAPFRCLSGFVIGMMLYDVRHAATRWSDATIVIVQSLAVVAILAILAIRIPDPVIIPFFALLVIATWQDRGPVPIILRGRIVRWTGKLSYSVYLNHVCVIGLIAPFWYWIAKQFDLSVVSTRIVFIVLCFAVILVASSWTYTYIETTGRRYLRRLLSRSVRR